TKMSVEAAAAQKRAAAEVPLPLTSPEPTALSKDEAPVAVLLDDANALLRQGSLQQAQDAYSRALLTDIKNARTYRGMARVMKAQGNQNQALFYYGKAVGFSPRFWQAQFELAALDEQVGLYKEASEHYRAGLAVVPNNANGWHALAADMALVDDWYSDAEDAFKRAVQLDPKNAAYLRDLADLQVKQNEQDQAEANYRKALELAPNDEITQAHLASFLIVNRPTPDGFAEAGRLLQAAAKSNPNDVAVSYWQGRLSLDQGDARSAIPALVYTAEHSHRVAAADAWYSLSRAFTAIGDKPRAAKALLFSDRMRSLSLYLTTTESQAAENPHDIPRNLKLAILYIQDGDYQDATNQYQNVLRLAPENKAAQAGLAKLNAFLKAHPQALSSTN
ncbi:MAG TPA: tetratricopeptide repeat protein, partial [Capsulimonadaceae bacterium]|nr:tetratricopeptide repeat protein [Capsulimonadaceae bacterium]